MTIERLELKVTTTGSAGVAIGNTISAIPIKGKIKAVHLNYNALAPATTDVTLAMNGTPNENIINKANNATDVWIYPSKEFEDNTGADRLYAAAGLAVPTEFVVHDHLKLDVLQCDALTDAVVATIFYDNG